VLDCRQPWPRSCPMKEVKEGEKPTDFLRDGLMGVTDLSLSPKPEIKNAAFSVGLAGFFCFWPFKRTGPLLRVASKVGEGCSKARCEYVPCTLGSAIPWLPHSFDRPSPTWLLRVFFLLAAS